MIRSRLGSALARSLPARAGRGALTRAAASTAHASTWSSAPSAASPKARLKYVTSDEIEAHLLAGLTAADDEARPVNLVQDKEGARRVLATLQELGPDHFHACDTEVAQIDVKAVGPVGNGKVRGGATARPAYADATMAPFSHTVTVKVTCLSIYSGPDVDFGNGPYVWVDNLDSAEGTLEYFR